MAKTFKIAVLAGDGIGTEIMGQGIAVLKKVSEIYKIKFEFKEALIGGAAYDATGNPFPEETKKICDGSDAIFFGSVGGPKWEKLAAELTPERGALLPLRKRYDLFANLRPAIIYPELAEASPIKKEIIGESLDILIFRELTSGIYFGKKESGVDWASDEMKYSRSEIERIVKVACEAAMKRKKKLCSIDKANVLNTSKFWRKTTIEFVEKNFPQIELSHMYVDNAAMQLIKNPKQFDVVVTENMFGDILTDEASQISGSIGMLASASLNGKGFGLYEPIHGSAPDIAGQDKANPIAQILSGAMMLRYSFGLEKEAKAIENAVRAVLKKGYRTGDIKQEGCKLVGTREMGEEILKEIN